MFDLNFYYALFDCIKSSVYDLQQMIQPILSIRSPHATDRYRNLIDDNIVKYEKYKMSGIIEYIEDYMLYFR